MMAVNEQGWFVTIKAAIYARSVRGDLRIKTLQEGQGENRPEESDKMCFGKSGANDPQLPFNIWQETSKRECQATALCQEASHSKQTSTDRSTRAVCRVGRT
jgi:hypothetical protein